MFTLISIPSLVTTLKITSEKEKSWMEISQKTESDFNTRLDFKWKNRVSLIILEPLYVDLIQINVNHQRQGHKTPTATLTQQNMEHNTQHYLKITTALLSSLLTTLQAFQFKRLVRSPHVAPLTSICTTRQNNCLRHCRRRRTRRFDSCGSCFVVLRPCICTRPMRTTYCPSLTNCDRRSDRPQFGSPMCDCSPTIRGE